MSKSGQIAEYEGEYYITIWFSGISFLCLLVDGVPTASWRGDRKQYIKLDDAIEWYRKEAVASPRCKRYTDTMVALLLRKAKLTA